MTVSPTIPAPVTPNSLLDSWLEGWKVTVNGLNNWTMEALTRGPAAFDFPRWMDLMTTRGRPSWTTPHEVARIASVCATSRFPASAR